MPNWNDPAVIEQNAAVFSGILLVVLGLYAWEFLNTLWFEASFIFYPQRKWRVQHVSYFACRYSFLAVAVIITAFYNLTAYVNCPAFGQSAQVLGNIAIGTATLNILYRAWAISLRYSRLLTISLAIAEIGHWALLIWNVFTVHSEWVPSVSKCNVTLTSRTALVTLYVYTMLFDFTILIICIVGLLKHKRNAAPSTGQGQILQLLRRQGIAYFFISFTANLFPFIFIVLNLNPVMNAITTVPAACATTIASCRAVIWLTTWGETDGSGFPNNPEIQLAPSAASGRRRTVTKVSKSKSKSRDLEVGGLATGDVGLPSEIFARTRRNDEEPGQVVSSSEHPSDFKTPTSPSHFSPISAADRVILTLSDRGENQAGAFGSTASSLHRPDTSPLLVSPKGYYPFDDRGRRPVSPDSRPSTD